jgi:hypothetical protein
MYEIYVKNKGLFKLMMPYKLYGTYNTSEQVIEALSDITQPYEDIKIMKDGKQIRYIDLSVNKPKNVLKNDFMEPGEKTKRMDDMSINIETDKKQIKNNKDIKYKIVDKCNNELFTIVFDKANDMNIEINNITKFEESLSKYEMFKFEVWSLRYVKGVMSSGLMNDSEIIETLSYIFNKSITDLGMQIVVDL